MEDVFERPVSIAKSGKPFGDLTLDEVRTRAAELTEAVGWGPTAKVRPVAQAWQALATAMESEGAATVRALGDTATDMARALWVIPPAGGFLSS
jgi:hypothetical protein